jgi:hypothetical protein
VKSTCRPRNNPGFTISGSIINGNKKDINSEVRRSSILDDIHYYLNMEIAKEDISSSHHAGKSSEIDESTHT